MHGRVHRVQRNLQSVSEDASAEGKKESGMEKKLLIKLYKSIFHFRLIFCSNIFIPFLITSPFIVIAFIHSRPAALAAQDLYSSSKQITVVAHANSKVISTPVVLPILSDRPQPATTNTHVRSHARRSTVEISLRLFCGFYP